MAQLNRLIQICDYHLVPCTRTSQWAHIHAHTAATPLLIHPTSQTASPHIYYSSQSNKWGGWRKLLFSLSLSLSDFLSYPSLFPSTSISSLPLLYSCHLTSPEEELLLLQQTFCEALGFRRSQPVIDAGSQGSRQPGSRAALPSKKMSNSLIVIMCLCHPPIIGMIKDEIFREAGLLTWSGRDIGPVENEFYQL